MDRLYENIADAGSFGSVYICKKLIPYKNRIAGICSQKFHCLPVILHRRLMGIFNISGLNLICKRCAHDAAVLTSERPAAQQKDAAALRKAGPADLDGLITGFVCIRDCTEQRVSLCAEAQRRAADAERENDRNRGKQANSLQ